MSEASIELPPKEETAIDAACAACGKTILTEHVTVGTGVPIPYRRVVGSFVQFLDSDGLPLGPWWAYCPDCVGSGKRTSPIDLPEVADAYERLKNNGT